MPDHTRRHAVLAGRLALAALVLLAVLALGGGALMTGFALAGV
jgi:hypothetical protein